MELDRAYEVLGLVPGASQSEVRRAYRSQVRTWHPDRYVDEPRLQLAAQEKLKQVNEAYRLIQAELALPPKRRQPPVATPPPKPAPPQGAGQSTATPPLRPNRHRHR